MTQSPPTHWPSFLRQIYALEQSWNAHKVRYPREDAVHFLPFPIPQFISLLTEAVQAAPTRWDQNHDGGPREEFRPARNTFLDVGCGPGTKIQLAQALFGLQGYGIDIIPAFIAEAQQAGVKAGLIDAFDFNSYDAFDIVFANRPSTLQDKLEKLLAQSLAPQCVLIAANWRHDPAEFGLEMIAKEYERPVCGVWRKPE
jgi:SAM-dependent methyltransferase